MDNILRDMEHGLEDVKQQLVAAWNDNLSEVLRKLESLSQCAILLEPVVPEGSAMLTHVLYLQFYLEHNFKVKDIAHMLGCSKRTIERRMAMHGLNARTRYTPIRDEDLRDMIKQILQFNSNMGEKSVEGALRARGVVIQRARVRDIIYDVDSIGVQERLRNTLHRRVYNVKSPNALWHVDSHHKLIRWRLVTHGAVDGYSRVIPYLLLAGNNRSDTALSGFLRGVDRYGLPSRVRCDKGGENVLIAEYMITHRGSDRGTIITGRSVHNQRVKVPTESARHKDQNKRRNRAKKS